MKIKALIQPNKGQATLEAAVASVSLMAFAVLLLALLYFCILKTYLQFSSHEFLICREISEPWTCEKKFKTELQSVLRFGKIESLWARKEANRQSMQLRMSFSVLDKKIQWRYTDQIPTPRADL